MKRFALIVALVSLSTAAQAQGPVLSATRYGKVVFGDRLDDVERRLMEKAPPIPDTDEQACRFIEFKTYPGISFMVEEGRVTRADASERVKTAIGYSVGSSLTAIRRHLPRAVVTPHHYEPGGHYVEVISRGGKAALLMEESNGVITHIRGGLIPSVRYVEGCL